ncbi:MAG: YidC/Oxa1 family membrane protein insertase [Epsilonproteobacteria bacterium]|nr:YidC/Oxa1 family membrane protein insertase [Campylobacterota bacterium]
MVSLDNLESILEEDNIIFLTYGGVFTQSLIVGMTGVLEKEVEEAELSMKTSNNIFVIFIELAQNVMNYSKSARVKETLNPKALVYVGKLNENYFVSSQNIITKEDKEKMEPMLNQITNSTQAEIKQMYRDVRRSGKATHEKGGGLGFLEVAKKAKKIEYSFKDLQNGKYYYKICATL